MYHGMPSHYHPFSLNLPKQVTVFSAKTPICSRLHVPCRNMLQLHQMSNLVIFALTNHISIPNLQSASFYLTKLTPHEISHRDRRAWVFPKSHWSDQCAGTLSRQTQVVYHHISTTDIVIKLPLGPSCFLPRSF